MSKKKEPFDAAINELHGVIGEAEETGIWDDLIGECKAAIRVLKDWPKWEPLIEAAGKVDKQECLTWIDEMSDVPVVITEMLGTNEWATTYNSRSISPKQEIRALLEALPERAKEQA